jgi:hypothetical protein
MKSKRGRGEEKFLDHGQAREIPVARVEEQEMQEKRNPPFSVPNRYLLNMPFDLLLTKVDFPRVSLFFYFNASPT